MIWDILIISICTFVILKKTNNIWVTAIAYVLPYMTFRAFGNNPILFYLVFSAGMFIYGIIIFWLLKRFLDEGNTKAFTVVFCLSSLLKGLVIGWG